MYDEDTAESGEIPDVTAWMIPEEEDEVTETGRRHRKLRVYPGFPVVVARRKERLFHP